MDRHVNDLLPKRANEDYLRHNSRVSLFFVEAMSICMVYAVFCCIPMSAFSITLDEAIKRALVVSYTVKEQKEVIKRTEYSYISTIDPYLPRIDIKSSYIWSLNGQTSVSQLSSGIPVVGGVVDTFASRNIFTYTGSISLRLFDGGERYSKRKGAYSLLEKEQERLKGVRVDVLYFVKTTFYIALGNKAIVETRKDAYRTAEKVYALTKGRYDEGVLQRRAKSFRQK